MAKRSLRNKAGKQVEALTHAEAKRKNIPTAEHQSVMAKEAQDPIRVAYERRNRDLDPQLVWRGKDEKDWSDLVVQAPPLYIQEKVHPKVLIDDLLRRSMQQRAETAGAQTDLFADFNGIPEGVDKTEFYRHDQNWSNRMILGDSLQVMASLAEREGLRGRVQCIYFDPPYGIKFNSNFQWSTTSRDVKDGKADNITREPEQVKAFRDTWRDGIHSYLTYLRDRLTVARDLLTDSGSIFVQIGDENVHRVRAVMDEVFGDENFVGQIAFNTTSGAGSFSGSTNVLASITNYILWFGKNKERVKYRELMISKSFEGVVPSAYNKVELKNGLRRSASEAEKDGALEEGARLYALDNLVSQTTRTGQTTVFPVLFNGKELRPKNGGWKTNRKGMDVLVQASRVDSTDERLGYVRYLDDFAAIRLTNVWSDVVSSFMSDKLYVVQTNQRVIQRCLLMATDPGDLVLDPTCGSGTTATVAEQWGRRWITIDTSRVALALARARIMGARYPFYLLADSREGQEKEAEITRTAPSSQPVHGNIRHGFVYERVPHITLKSIANNAEIDVIWEQWQTKLEPLRHALNKALGQDEQDLQDKNRESASGSSHPVHSVNPVKKRAWQEWEIPREADAKWPDAAKKLHTAWWEARIARQKEIDASIAAKAEFEYLYDKPYEDKKTVRVAGPFTVESLSPHRVLGVDEDDELIDTAGEGAGDYGRPQDFATMILENLRTAGVQQAHKEDRIVFTALTPWPGAYICAEGRFEGSEKWLVASGGKGEDGKSKQSASQQSLSTKHYLRAGIFIGPEFGTVSRPDLVAAAREAGDAGFDVLIACAFSYDARSCDFDRLGSVPVLKARMNADLHMAEDLKNTGKGNLFVIFGEPDIEVVSGEWLVARNGRMVGHYESCKELSGLGCLEEINRLGGTDLPRLKRLSAGREVRPDQPDSQGGGVGGIKHRGGRGADNDGGVSTVSERGKLIAGGSGDTTDPGGPAGLSGGAGTGDASGTGGGDQPHAGRAQALAAIQDLKPDDFPLSLTTSHYAQITINGVDVFHPQTGEVRSDGAEGIACWFIDTDYNEESFFVRHAYFLGQNDPYKALKTTLKAEIDEEAWESLHSDTSRPFEKPANGRIAVKVINHLGDEVMKVFRV